MLKGLGLAACGGLHRWRGGFWCGRPERGPDGEWNRMEAGEPWVSAGTVAALERRGLVERAGGDMPDWCAPRFLTETGEERLEQARYDGLIEAGIARPR